MQKKRKSVGIFGAKFINTYKLVRAATWSPNKPKLIRRLSVFVKSTYIYKY